MFFPNSQRAIEKSSPQNQPLMGLPPAFLERRVHFLLARHTANNPHLECVLSLRHLLNRTRLPSSTSAHNSLRNRRG